MNTANGGASKSITNAIEGKDNIWDGVATSAFTGALSGALASTDVDLVGQMIGGGTIAMAGNAIQQGIDIAQGKKAIFDTNDMWID